MNSNYHSRHHENHRKMLDLLIKEMHPHMVYSEDYEKGLARFFRSDEEEQRKWKPGTVRTFATCLECFGFGAVENPGWYDDDECQDPESIDCETCRGVGLVEIVDLPTPAVAAPDDDMPF